MLKKAVLLTNYNWYESNRYFVEKFADAMLRKGIETKILDVNSLSIDHLKEIIEFAPDFTLSFNSIKPIRSGYYFWDFLRIPHLFILLDPPFFYDQSMYESKNLMLSCVDRNDVKAVKEAGFGKVFFLPHAASIDIAFDEKAERKYDAVFIGTCHDYESIRNHWQTNYSKEISQILEDASALIFCNERLSLTQALQQAWQASERKLQSNEQQIYSKCFYLLDRYTRGKDRVELIRSITDAQIHIFGALASKDIDPFGQKGWEGYLANQSNVVLHPSINFKDSLEVLKQAKIVLNSSPFFRDGSHERIFMSLACGAFPVTSESLFFRQEFIDGEDILFYQGLDRKNINDRINMLLQNEAKRQLGVRQGRKKVLTHHTWDNRVDSLITNLCPLIDKIRATQLKPISLEDLSDLSLILNVEESKKGAFMPQNICFLVYPDDYARNRHFSEKLAEAMARRNIEIKSIDVQEKTSSEIIKEVHQFSPQLICSFRKAITPSDHEYDDLKIPHLSLLLDSAFYTTTLTNNPYSIIACADRNDYATIRSESHPNVLFFPQAVEIEVNFEEDDKLYDVVFFGSCYDYESLRMAWRQRHTESLNKMLDDAIDIVFSNEKASLAQALVEAWNASSLDQRGIDFPTLYAYLDNYTRGKDRVELIRSIKNAKVHVFGELASNNAVGILGWHQYLSKQSNVTLHPSLLYGEMLNVLKKAKIALNSSPFFRDGAHERVFAALACGALPISSESTYLREQFTEGKEILFYQANNLSSLSGNIDSWLADESKRKAAVQRGREIVINHHTWDTRVNDLIQELPLMMERIKMPATFP